MYPKKIAKEKTLLRYTKTLNHHLIYLHIISHHPPSVPWITVVLHDSSRHAYVVATTVAIALVNSAPIVTIHQAYGVSPNGPASKAVEQPINAKAETPVIAAASTADNE